MSARLRGVAASLLLLAGTLAVACSSGGEGGEPAGAVLAGEAGLESGYPKYVDAASGLSVILGTPDLAVGRQRVAFVLSDAEGVVRLPVARITSSYAASGDEAPRESTSARFYEFPEGVRGIYVAELTFDRAGEWIIEVSFPRPDGSTAATSFRFPVAERSRAPAVGDLAPASHNRTLRDASSIHELSTGSEPAPALYEQTIAEALAEQRPLVVVFASPGFCTNALCGPQAEVLSALHGRYGDRASFIHVDLYENPQEIRGAGLDVAIETPLLEEWGLETDEWTFVIDAAGAIAARFEAFTPEVELEQALLAVLDRS